MSHRFTLSALMALSILLGACAGVLGLKHTTSSHPFEHRAHVLKGINCLVCHEGVTNEKRGDAPHYPSDATCTSCHKSPHDTRPCQGCHAESYVKPSVDLARRHLRFEHAKHASTTHGQCMPCHSEIAQVRPASVVPPMPTCFACHQHQDQWTTRDCDGCHVDLKDEGTKPSDHMVHDGDWIREHGVQAASSRDLCATCHSERSCAACHGVGTVPALPSTLAFDDVKMQGLHRAGFFSRHPDEARASPGLCTTCHSEQSCIECHQRKNVAGGTTRSPHPIGWVTGAGGGEHGLQARIDPASCAACHGGAGEQLCIGCHKVGGPGGNPHGRSFHSTRDKTHDLPCRQCHAGGP